LPLRYNDPRATSLSTARQSGILAPLRNIPGDGESEFETIEMEARMPGRPKKVNAVSKAKKGGLTTELVRMTKNPLVREIAAAAAVAVAGVLLRNRAVRSTARKVGEGARDAASETANAAGRAGEAIASAVTRATRRKRADHDETRVQPTRRSRPKPPNGTMPYVS
jgi:hypothetical protein